MIKKMTALLLALVLAVSCMPFTAYATKSSITLEDAVDSDKYYFLSLNQIPSSALDISDDGYAQLWEITQGQTHSFKIHEKGGYYYFEDYETEQVLEVENGNAAKLSKIVLADYDGSDKQLWSLNNNGENYYEICSKLNSGLAINNYYARKNNGNTFVLHPHNFGSNEIFAFVEDTSLKDEKYGSTDTDAAETTAFENDLERYGLAEEYSIVPCCAGGARVDMSTASDRSIQLYKTTLGTNQLWTLGKVGEYYYIKSKYDGKVVEVPGGNAASGAVLSCADYNGSDKQLWALENMNDGTFALHSKLNNGLVWDVQNNTSADFSKILLYPQHGYSNQRFRFIHISSVEPVSEWGSKIHDCEGTNRDIWDGSYTYDWYYGHQNDNDFYLNSASDLAGLASLVQNGNGFGYKTVHLMCDINLADINWTPIGFNDRWFYGSFNGHDHSIIGLRRDDKTNNNGLFGQFYGGTLCNLAVKGTMYGDYNTGGVVGNLERGYLYNIYSEVTIRNAADDFAGGIVGKCGYAGFIEHCTQNAKVNSNDQDNHRGGIVGYTDGNVRYCVNNARVYCNWNCVGGIAGTLSGGRVDYCANYGTVGGGDYAERIGGIVGESKNQGTIYGCYNEGTVFSDDDDYVGGIDGRCDGWYVSCSINLGRVYGDDQVGGISGWGKPVLCFNAGIVTGDSEVGAVSGADSCSQCLALAWSAANLSGTGSDNSNAWVNSADTISGKVCRMFNDGGAGFTQNIGSDPYPTFGASKVTESGGKYINSEYRVSVDYVRGYGTVTGAGVYKSGAVKLKAIPADGCVFDHFEVKSAKSGGKMTAWNGSEQPCPAVDIKTYKSKTITLTKNIAQSYSVRAVFKIFDEVPEDMKVKVKLELECVDDAEGWNSSEIPVTLVDTAGVEHTWEASRYDLDAEGEKQEHTFDLGAANPVAVYATPDFGGGLTFRSYGLKARMWINGSGQAIESGNIVIRSWPFISSKWGDDYMHITFGDSGNSKVGFDYDDKEDNWLKSFTSCKQAWEEGKSNDEYTIRLESAWLLDAPLTLEGNKSVRLDLNGYPIIRSMKKTDDNGEVFKINGGATLTIVDSNPSRPGNGNFTGGSIQGGRSDDTAGLIECQGTLNMTGGTLYNGGTTDKGGAIKLTGNGIANLDGTLISNCWTDKARFTQNEGGAIYMSGSATANLKNCTVRYCRALDYGGGIYMEDSGNALNCENVNVIACKTNENLGAGVYQDLGETNWVGGSIKSCRAEEDDGGGFYQDEGKVYMENVRFDSNYSEDNGGAFYSNTDDGTWFIGCDFAKNRADDHGGAVYLDNNYLYLEDCTVTSNTSGKIGGGLYIDSAGSVDVYGKVIIRNNDGTGTMDNLVLESGAFIYDHGLFPGSEIHLRSESNGDVKIGNNLTSEWQMFQYFRPDYGHLDLVDTETLNTELRASTFNKGKTAMVVGIAVIIIAIAGAVCFKKKHRKEEHNETA
ncbi:MAG: RICIN domain-containing protein [Clostridia bacterium]|nr:RICIN domain-containing protein [Clostridia bacterium]